MAPRPMMLLISGATATWARHLQERPDIYGAFVTPRSRNRIPSSGRWAGDNGAYSGFHERAFRRMLERCRSERARCLFVAAPDVVGLSVATGQLYLQWEPVIRAAGYPVAYVAQDGLVPGAVPWARVDTLFVGGALESGWKTSAEAVAVVEEARRRGKWVHMGRVNTRDRLHFAQAIGVDSVDGSGFSRYPSEMLRRHGKHLVRLAAQRRLHG